MKIAINISPLNSLHAGRGIGQYTALLVESLKTYDQKNTYVYFSDKLNARVDIVHYPFFDLFQPTLKIINNTKTILTVHDLIPLKYPKKFPSGIRGKIAWWRQKNTLKKINAVITDSLASARDIHAFTNIPKDKIHVVPLAVSKEYKHLSASEISKLDLKKYDLSQNFILYVGDINWNKNIPGLLKAFSKLVKDSKFSDFQLVLVGSAFLKSNLVEVQELNKIISSEKIEEKVKKVGYVPLKELVGIFNLASLYVQPSFDEGFGLSPLEALSCGTLVVSSSCGSLPEVVGKAGEYFDPAKQVEIVEVMKKVLEYSAITRNEKIEKGLQQAALFSAKEFIEQTIKVYEKAVINS